MAQQDLEKKENENANEGYPTVGLKYKIYPFKGIDGNRKYLSCSKDGDYCDLWGEVDKSGRQEWLCFKSIDNRTFNIQVWDGVFNDRKLLSCNKDGGVNIWKEDDNSGRQQWEFNKLFKTGDNKFVFNIKPKGGVDADRKFLSCNKEGEQVNLWKEDDGSGRQQWIVEVIDEMTILKIEYNIDEGKILNDKPMVIQKQIFPNNSSVQQSIEWKFTSAKTTQSTFTYQDGFTLTIAMEASFGIPEVGDGKITTSASTTRTFTNTETETKMTEETYSFPLIVPAHTKLEAVATITESLMDVPYTATLKSKSSGNKVTQSGIWTGTSVGTVRYTINNVEDENKAN